MLQREIRVLHGNDTIASETPRDGDRRRWMELWERRRELRFCKHADGLFLGGIVRGPAETGTGRVELLEIDKHRNAHAP